jgi:acetyl-CoA acetyltransferase
LTARRASVAVIGLGHSKVFRHADIPLGALAAEACLAAVADAGLQPSDIDGVSTDPEQPFDGAGSADGTDLVSPQFIVAALGLETGWAQSVNGMVGHAFIEAVNAVAAGACSYALVFRALRNPAGRYGVTSPAAARGRSQFIAPYGLFAPGMYAHYGQRYFDTYGGGREQLATFAVQNRRNGLLNEHSYWRQQRPESLTIDDYMAAPMVSSPLCRYDCDIPLDGCGAFVLTTAERAAEHVERPAYILGTSSPIHRPRGIVPSLEDFHAAGAQLGRRLWASAGVGPGDVGVANLYDGFSILTPLWMEALGLCAEGEALAMIHAGHTTIDAELPLNTSGGNQGAGRMHGVPHLMEGALQVMRRAGTRQVDGADISLSVVGPLHHGAGVVFCSSPTVG